MLLAICEGKPLIPEECPHVGPIVLIFDVFFFVDPNQLETVESLVIQYAITLLWRHCTVGIT